MSRLVVIDPRKGWLPCLVCKHLVNPKIKICDEAWHHLPCSADGCITEERQVNGDSD